MDILRKLVWLVILLLLIGTVCSAQGIATGPLSTEIERWQTFIRTNQATDEDWISIRDLAEPILAKADQAMRDGHSLYALHLLASVRYMVQGQQFVQQHPAKGGNQMAALEAEWKQAGLRFQPILHSKSHPVFDGMPAALRAIAEASYSEIRPYYESSLEYGKNTVADAGLFYLGAALAQSDVAQFCKTLNAGHSTNRLNIRNLPAEMDSLEDKLLAAYIPPASIDSHPLFIRASAMLKEARELNSAGMQYGALYRYLAGRVRLSKITNPDWTITPEEAASRADEIRRRLDADKNIDHSIATMFLEMALVESMDPTPGVNGGKQSARAVFEEVIPHYLATLAPPKPQPPKPVPVVTVTLVRWPYT